MSNSVNVLVEQLLQEKPLEEAERDKLKDSDFGLPKTRSFPIHDAEHVRKAIQYFHHCPDKCKEELAKNIIKAAKKLNVHISDTSEIAKHGGTGK